MGWNLRKKTVVSVIAVLLVGIAVSAMAAAAEPAAPESATVLKDFLYRCLNFVLLFGALAYFSVKPIRRALKGRRDGVEKALTEAEKVKADAEAKFAEYDEKLNRASAEIDQIYEAIRKEGEMEREKILASARETAEKIKKDAEASASYEVAKARGELRREAAQLAIQIAEEMLEKNLTKEDHSRLVEEYMSKVGELH